MTVSKGRGDASQDVSATASADEVENLLRAAKDGSLDAMSTAAASEIESVDFMIDDQNELVDLDALFDALNVAANEGVDAMSYIEDQHTGNVLTVTNEALAKSGVSASLDELGSGSDDLLKDQIISDQS